MSKALQILEKLSGSDREDREKKFWTLLPQLGERDLVKILTKAKDVYYNTGASFLKDIEYDALEERLKLVNPDAKILSSVGAPVLKNKVDLPVYMPSLDKIKTQEATEKWLAQYPSPHVVSRKLDGISCAFIWDGKSYRLYTRGDGHVGQDITPVGEEIQLLKNPKLLPKKPLMVRGELIVSKEDWARVKSLSEEERNDARSMISGLVNTSKSKRQEDQIASVRFVAFSLLSPQMKPSQGLRALKKYGFYTVFYELWEDLDWETLDEMYYDWRADSPYEMDGIVVSTDTIQPQITQGKPSTAIAYKGLTEILDAKVESVRWKASKDGKLVPRVFFDPIKISGVTVTKASGIHAKYIQESQINTGAVVKLIRSGDVIPYILGVVKPAKKIAEPDTDLPYHWDKNGVNYWLDDPDRDPQVQVNRMAKFFKDMGMDYISEGLAATLVAKGIDILQFIKMKPIDFAALDGFADKLALKIYRSKEKALENVQLLDLMVASNMTGLGVSREKLTKILTAYPKIVDEYEEEDEEEWVDKLSEIYGLGEITARAFLEELPTFQEFYQQFRKIHKVQGFQPARVEGDRMAGEVVVFTGFRDKDLKDWIVSEGGKVGSSVSKNTTLVVYVEGNENNAKYQKAQELGIRKITLEKLQEELNE